ncbi:cell cycle control protein, putative [Entamoeba histolytica HM-1:IMSS-B]|uniref:Cell cycle control protein, putative n=4 Tax=Entamoeba histolytica TaxID=5759 RepID=C4LYG3_ENTH1|nr:cell cycle control protein, putative [Entamoeba histolytica HM-1:IMSS]EAL51921.1 cell cycle control protein, putative [Entamoeba histolytica HM-1:IMSS]EMH72720.1 cell cycle control protein, putative [Entamoeba histolytica HM-1:IMSS-B]ENY64479.1 pre-mRNA-splicing factor cwc22, putative [Entamoeba histolytica HM-1:IMSS-A]GAT93859.1 cell cycle control protein putative [Entamoeba histolytica]|eukprot:XP_657300.1 cell cycle control protein, putative [Entamoeba histolytica HM-1:IMSS]
MTQQEDDNNYSNEINSPQMEEIKTDIQMNEEKEEKIEKQENKRIEKPQTRKEREEYQKQSFIALKRTLNGLVNKVSLSNIKTIIVELFKENLVRGKGLFVNSVIRAQDAEPNFSNIYATLIAVINTKIPAIGELTIHRIIHQFNLTIKREEEDGSLRKLQFIAQLTNQQVCSVTLPLQILIQLMKNPTDENIEKVVTLLLNVGEYFDSIIKGKIQPIYEQLRGIVSRKKASERIYFKINQLLNERRNGFINYPSVIEELDLIEDEDKITHTVDLTTPLNTMDELNLFKFDEEFEQNERKWEIKKAEIIGEESEEEEDDDNQIQEQQKTKEETEIEKFDDQTGAEEIFLKKKIYITIMSCYNFEECVHKLLSLKLREGEEKILVEMVIECCSQEKTYKKYYGLASERLCVLHILYKNLFIDQFKIQYQTIHLKDMNQIRNIAMLYSYLFYSNAIPWELFSIIKLTDDDTTSSSRVFLKIMFQNLFEEMGMKEFKEKLFSNELQESVRGMFPTEDKEHIIFAFNFFKGIGLVELAKPLQQNYLALKEKMKKEND